VKPPLERDIQKQIMDGLRADGWLVWRNQTGATLSTYMGKSRMVRFGARGQSDLFALRNGVFLSVEVKRQGQVATPEQEEWLVSVLRHGGIGVVAYDYRDVQAVIERHEKCSRSTNREA
jgi:hypothetical protein